MGESQVLRGFAKSRRLQRVSVLPGDKSVLEGDTHWEVFMLRPAAVRREAQESPSRRRGMVGRV